MNPVRTHFRPIPVLPAVIAQGDCCVDLAIWHQLKGVPWTVVDGPRIFRLYMNLDTLLRVHLTFTAPGAIEVVGNDEAAGVAGFARGELGNWLCASADQEGYE